MPPRLLLADDSITIQKVIELTFADEKIDVVAVSDGEQAITRLVSEPFDIVLADIGMPVKDGFEVAAFVKGHADLAHIPVILLTGAFEPVDDVKASALGVAAVLAKPFEPQVLVSRVRDLLRSAKAAARPPATPPTLDVSAARAVAPMPRAGESASTSADEYFERLDRAFANLNAPLEPRAPVRSFPRAVPEPASDRDGGDDESDISTDRTMPQVEALATGVPPLPEPASALAKTFATLLAVEQGELPVSAL